MLQIDQKHGDPWKVGESTPPRKHVLDPLLATSPRKEFVPLSKLGENTSQTSVTHWLLPPWPPPQEESAISGEIKQSQSRPNVWKGEDTPPIFTVLDFPISVSLKRDDRYLYRLLSPLQYPWLLPPWPPPNDGQTISTTGSLINVPQG